MSSICPHGADWFPQGLMPYLVSVLLSVAGSHMECLSAGKWKPRHGSPTLLLPWFCCLHVHGAGGVHLAVSTAKEALNDIKSVTLTAHANPCASIFVYGLVIVK